MEIREVAVWSVLSGGLLTVAAAAAFDVAYSRSIGAVRNLFFVLITASACVMMTGLPEVFFPDLPIGLTHFLKVSLGPLAGAISLTYLGIWLGGLREDVVAYRLTAWGGAVLLAATLGLAMLGLTISDSDYPGLLFAAGVVNMAAVLLGLIATLRATLLGDPLARWMLAACGLLAGAVAGLYARGLSASDFGLGAWVLTAMCTLGYYLLASLLIIIRNRHERQLQRLSRMDQGADPATGLPTGSMLLSEVEHIFWRAARSKSMCTLVCLHLGNLYELGQAAGRGVEHQILVTMAARIRRSAGFRCIVGLYHPRCFVVVLAADQQRSHALATVTRLRRLVAQPLSVVGANRARHDFMPQLGVGVVTVDPAMAKPLEAINQAERTALGVESRPRDRQASPTFQDQITTNW